MALVEEGVAEEAEVGLPAEDMKLASNPKSSIFSTSSSVVTDGACFTVASSVSRETDTESTPSIFLTSVVMEFEHDEHVIPPTWITVVTDILVIEDVITPEYQTKKSKRTISVVRFAELIFRSLNCYLCTRGEETEMMVSAISSE